MGCREHAGSPDHCCDPLNFIDANNFILILRGVFRMQAQMIIPLLCSVCEFLILFYIDTVE